MTWRDAQQYVRDNDLTFDGYTAQDGFEAGWAAALASAPTVDVDCPTCEGASIKFAPRGEVLAEYRADCPDCHGTGKRRALLLGQEVEVVRDGLKSPAPAPGT